MNRSVKGLAVFAALGLLVAACTDGSRTSQTVTTSSEDAVRMESPSTTTTRVVPASSATVPASTDDVPTEAWPFEVRDIELPPRIETDHHLATGAIGTVVVSWGQTEGQRLWFSDGESWSSTLLTDLFGTDRTYTPWVSEVVWWRDAFWAFLMGDLDAELDRPTVLVSTDGRSWVPRTIGPVGGAAMIGGLLATPESPPREGAAAVADVAIWDDELMAVGWVSAGLGVSVPTMWRSTDGERWAAAALPNLNAPNEWAWSVAVGPAGFLVGTVGSYHWSRELLYSADGRSWADVSLPDAEVMALTATSDGFAVSTTQFGSEPYDLRFWSDGEWTRAAAPAGRAVSDLVDTPRGLVALAARTSPHGDWSFTEVWSLEADGWVRRLGEAGLSELWSDASGLHAVRRSMGRTTAELLLPATHNVVLVEGDDVLNVRADVLGVVVDTLAPDATGVRATGLTRTAPSGTWMEVITPGGVVGWANARYLTLEVDAAAGDRPRELLDRLAEALAGDGDLTRLLGPKGLTVEHFATVLHWGAGSDPMADPTRYEWTGEAGEPPWPDATFAEQVASLFIEAWNDPNRVVAADVGVSGPEAAPPWVPIELGGFHYLAVHDPGEQSLGHLDWMTWYVGFDWTEAGWKVATIWRDSYAP